MIYEPLGKTREWEYFDGAVNAHQLFVGQEVSYFLM